MRKILMCIGIIALTIGLTGCGKKNENNNSSDTPSSVNESKVFKTGKTGEVDIIYYNPVSDKGCSVDEYVNNSDKVGTTGCLKWYVIENSDANKDTVRVILDHNTTANYVTIDSIDESTTDRSKIENGLSMLMNKSKWKVEPTILTTDELARILNMEKVTMLEYPRPDIPDYSWLYDNMGDSTHSFAYWLSGDEKIGYPNMAYIIEYTGRVNERFGDDLTITTPGIRPVISINKENL